MTTEAKASFALKSWDEKTWEGVVAREVEGEKLTHSINEYSYDGDITGESTLHYLMFYREDQTGIVTGLEKIVGTLGGRSGSFVLRHDGVFDKLSVKETLTVVPGSGTGELAGLTGTGSLDISGHAERYPIVLNYDFE